MKNKEREALVIYNLFRTRLGNDYGVIEGIFVHVK